MQSKHIIECLQSEKRKFETPQLIELGDVAVLTQRSTPVGP